jgi:ATP-dependent helicase HrpB
VRADSTVPEPLPIDPVLPGLVAALQRAPCAVLRAPTGAGKTTRVPPALLDAGLAGRGQVLMLEPRRVAARSAAARMAFERGGALGAEIGYQVRLERRSSAATRILVVTEGLLVRMLQDDPFLESAGAVVFDEFHERSLDTDLALAMVRAVQRQARGDLKLVVMSATLRTDEVAEYLGGAPVVTSEGRAYPVEVRYEQRAAREDTLALVPQAVGRAWSETRGDVLVFLPGVGEIRRLGATLVQETYLRGAAVAELYGDLPLEEQDRVLRRGSARRIVLATNVAQTSVTVPGVTAVVDTGLARVLRYDPGAALDRLELVRISRASAEQRAGRAGRLEPGLCLRLWTQAEQRSLAEHDEPEIARVDLSGALLQLAVWGECDPQRFEWLEAPPRAHLDRAAQLLERLGARRGGRVTELGRAMAELPLPPRLARLVLAGAELGNPRDACTAAALLAERSPWRREPGRRGAGKSGACDVFARVQALEDFERQGWRDSEVGHVDPAAARTLLSLRDRLLTLVRARVPARAASREESLRRALACAWSDRLARRREPGSSRGLMAEGRGVSLIEECGVREAEWFVCVDLDAGQRGERAEARVRLASAVEPDWIDPSRFQQEIELDFDPESERVSARRRRRLGQIVLESVSVPLPGDGSVQDLLLEAAAKDPPRALGLERPALARWLARWRCLAAWRPELELPRLEPALWRDVLADVVPGCSSFAELREAGVLEALRSRLTSSQLRALEEEVPDALRVPSGSLVPIEYEPGQAPVLAVRIQELFGLREAPAIARGRVRLRLHLLGPNFRPQQITEDLASFWRNTYPAVRAELKRRYPKHSWPEDPLTAAPERRGGGRPR